MSNDRAGPSLHARTQARNTGFDSTEFVATVAAVSMQFATIHRPKHGWELSFDPLSRINLSVIFEASSLRSITDVIS